MNQSHAVCKKVDVAVECEVCFSRHCNKRSPFAKEVRSAAPSWGMLPERVPAACTCSKCAPSRPQPGSPGSDGQLRRLQEISTVRPLSEDVTYSCSTSGPGCSLATCGRIRRTSSRFGREAQSCTRRRRRSSRRPVGHRNRRHTRRRSEGNSGQYVRPCRTCSTLGRIRRRSRHRSRRSRRRPHSGSRARCGRFGRSDSMAFLAVATGIRGSNGLFRRSCSMSGCPS